MSGFVTVDGIKVPIEGEQNLLALCRKANIDIPTFCYHSKLSTYGACRLCLVEVAGRGVQGACSTPPEPGLDIKVNTPQLREIRKIAVELLLANHDLSCPSCFKSVDCKLMDVARRVGVTSVRFKPVQEKAPLDFSSPSIIRDPNKCVLCGDCVRMCSEIQGIGAIGFAYRGHQTAVLPAFGKGLGEGECVGCGQCANVCPTGALVPRSEMDEVLAALADPTKTVVAQVAPAVRVGLGECFATPAGDPVMGRMAAALKRLGFDAVYDTTFAADLTVIEEGQEFLARAAAGEKLPQFTSCCPGWVQFAEQSFPELLPNLSSCRSPQQMFGALCKEKLCTDLNIPRENLVVVSIMPCTAKKFEANRPEFRVDGNKDVDHVLTTMELSLMIKEGGISFEDLEPGSFDMPFGFKTGAGVIFGSSGGVSEAVLRYAGSKLSHGLAEEFKQLRGNYGTLVSEVELGDRKLKLAVVSGLANTRKLIDKIRSGEEEYDLVEVMACCGGCVNGGGQPLTPHSRKTAAERAKGLYADDKMMHLHNSGENPYIQKLYDEDLTPEKAHRLLHTTYANRNRIAQDDIVLTRPEGDKKLSLKICFGTSCFLRGAQSLYMNLMEHIREQNLAESTEFTASFCGKACKKGPVLEINGKVIEHCTLDMAVKEIEGALG